MATKILSVEIGQGLTRVVEMDYKTKQPKIYHCFTFETPQNVVNDGIVNESDAFASVWKSECEKQGVKTKNVVFTVNSSRIARRDVKIPMVKEKQIHEVVLASAPDFLPVDMTQYVLAYDILERINTPEEKQLRMNLIAVPNELIQSYEALANFCGMQLMGLDYSGNSVYQIAKESFKEGVNIAIKLDEKNGMVTVLRDGKLDFQRAVNYGIDDAIETVRKYKAFGENLTYGEAIDVLCGRACIRSYLNPAEGYKETEDTSKEIAEARKAVTESLRHMIGMVAKVLEYYVSHNEDVVIDQIVLLGLGSDFSGLSKLMSNELNHKVRVFRNEQSEAISKMFLGGSLSISSYAACIGAGIRPMDIIAEEMKKDKKTAGQGSGSMTGGIFVFLILAILAAGLSAFALMQNLSESTRQEQLEAQIAELERAEAVYQEYIQSKANYDDFLSKYAMTVTPNTQLYSFIEELERKMPSSIRMISFSADGTSVTMSMKVNSKVEAADLLVQLRTFESLAEVNTSGITEGTDDEGRTTVTLTVNCTYAVPAALN